MILSENARNLLSGNKTQTAHYDIAENLIVRIAEIEVDSKRLNEYLQKAREIAAISMEKEKGVICLLPMQIDEKPNHLRILEIYRGEAAYQNHIKTEHFLKYKQQTADMVKNLQLIDMQPLNYTDLHKIFKKLN
ncbi:MAG: antibiotic biosynthesis monooxygenase [Bacteroidales bacterium]|nr:antibiotic biosynthesis monooxygenase [Bacteroidales bacterium]